MKREESGDPDPAGPTGATAPDPAQTVAVPAAMKLAAQAPAQPAVVPGRRRRRRVRSTRAGIVRMLSTAGWRTWEALPETSRRAVRPALASLRRSRRLHTRPPGVMLPPLPPDAVELDTRLGTLWFDGSDTRLTPWIRAQGIWEADVMKLMARRLRPGDVFVDVGANVGFHTIHAAGLVAPGGKVFAVEPVPETIALLEANVWRHGCDNVTALPFAASDESGTVRIALAQDHRSGAQIDAGGDVTAPAARLDELIPVHTCDVLKVDVEGAETLVLRGAPRLIEHSPRLLVVAEFRNEVHLSGESPAAVLAYYESLGFELCLIRRNGDLRPVTADAMLAFARRVDSFNIALRRR